MTFPHLNRRQLLGASLAIGVPAWASSPRPQVVASFSILADLVRQVGGHMVDVVSLVGVDADAHVFEPTPQDAMKLQRANVLVTNGLAFEAWMPRLKSASGFNGHEIVASRGVKARRFSSHAHEEKEHSKGHHHHHEDDPHAWQDIRNVVVYVRSIAEGLAQVDPSNAAHYQRRSAAYIQRLEKLDGSIRRTFGGLPKERRVAVTTHDAFGYYADAYGLRFVPARGLSTESEPSARDIALLIDQMRKERIQAVFIENISDPRLMEQLTRETGAVIGGKLYSDALSGPNGPASTYLDLMEANTTALFKAMASR